MNSKNIIRLTAWDTGSVTWKIQNKIHQILMDKKMHTITYPRSANFFIDNFFTDSRNVRRLTNLKLSEYEF